MNYTSTFAAIILCLSLLTLPRKFLFHPFVIAVCFIPMNQRLVLFNLDFTLLRMLIIVGLCRIKIKGESRIVNWNAFDKMIFIWIMIGSLIYVLQQASFNALILRAGVMLDTLGIYWLFRQVLQNWNDVFSALKIFAFFSIVTAPLIALEKFQETSFFSIFGPVTGMFHAGRFRAAGSFPHYIMMGCFWASLLPLFYARIKTGKQILFYWTAIIAALSNVYFSASSTPLLTVIAIIIFWKLYSYRKHGRIIFLGTCFGLLLLNLIMNAPVWHLMARANIFSGSTGWHRYFLFDNFIKHVSEWFFLGTKSTAHWGHAQQDITNQFVLEGVRGGGVTLFIFVIVIFYAVKIPGKASLGNIDSGVKWMAWGICVAMLGHFVSFWGVSYFGQMNLLLYFTFALVGFTFEQSTVQLHNTILKSGPNLSASAPSGSLAAASKHISS